MPDVNAAKLAADSYVVEIAAQHEHYRSAKLAARDRLETAIRRAGFADINAYDRAVIAAKKAAANGDD